MEVERCPATAAAPEARPGISPTVSVCVPLYNGARYLEACLDGISAQECRDFEVLIVDDGSTDTGPDIAKRRCARDPRFRFLANDRNLGLVGNWNRCIELAQGRWIKFLFQDDLIEPDCLGRMLAAGESGGGFVACARSVFYEGAVDPASRRWYDQHEAVMEGIYRGRPRLSGDEYSKAKLAHLDLNIVGEPSVTMIRRELFTRFGRFDPLLVQVCDSDMWNRLCSNVGIDYIGDKMVSFRVHSESMSRKNAGRRFRAAVLDEIVELTRLCRSPELASFRQCADAFGAKGSLQERLARKVNAAFDEARSARRERPPNPAPWSEIETVLPRLPGYLAHRVHHQVHRLRRLLRTRVVDPLRGRWVRQ